MFNLTTLRSSQTHNFKATKQQHDNEKKPTLCCIFNVGHAFLAVISCRHPVELVIFFQFFFFYEMLCTTLCCFVKNNKKICKTFVLLSAS